MSNVLSSEELWKEDGGYYRESVEALERSPRLPDARRLCDRRMSELFRRYGRPGRESRVLEIGCGQSVWLPFLAREFGCEVAGLDCEPHAAALAEANLRGANVPGRIFCRDAFDLRGNRDLAGQFDLVYSMGVMEHFDDAAERLETAAVYLNRGGRILTLVPNLQGAAWLLQRLGSLTRLRMHVIYDAGRLAAIHERAGFETVASGYVGFYDGFVSATDRQTGPWRRIIHDRLCWTSNMGAEAWIRLWRGRLTPEIRWLAPHVFYVGAWTGPRRRPGRLG